MYEDEAFMGLVVMYGMDLSAQVDNLSINIGAPMRLTTTLRSLSIF